MAFSMNLLVNLRIHSREQKKTPSSLVVSTVSLSKTDNFMTSDACDIEACCFTTKIPPSFKKNIRLYRFFENQHKDDRYQKVIRKIKNVSSFNKR